MSILLAFNVLFSLLNFLGGSSFESYVQFESLESKTANQKEVFNKIRLIQNDKLDIWIMKQSHGGLKLKEWDEIQIRVDKSQKPYKASYHQIHKGKEVEYKANCFLCHSGGPRYIRPNFYSLKQKVSLKDRLNIQRMNFLIQSYGEVKLKINNPFKRKVQIVKNPVHIKKTLNVKSCSNCHGEGQERGVLTYENRETIKFLWKRGLMPPWPYKVTKEDKKKINEFLYGF